MKIVFGIFSAALAAPVNQCPGTCWTENAGVCTPDLNELTISCNAGTIDVTANSCLFLPSNANLTAGFEVSFQGAPGNNDCTQTLSNHTDTFSGSWNFEELENCGWDWSNSSSVLTFANFLEVSGNPHQLMHGGLTIDIGTEVEALHLSCDYSNTLTLGSSFQANHTTFTQAGAASGSSDFTSAFSITLNEFNYTNNSTFISDGVIVGEELQVNIELDYAALGYTSKNSSKFGFYAEKCAIANADAPATKFWLVGSDDNSLNRNCLLDQAQINLGQTMAYEDQASWSKSEFNLEFLAFRFPTSGNLTAVCDLKICLEGDCPTDSAQSC